MIGICVLYSIDSAVVNKVVLLGSVDVFGVSKAIVLLECGISVVEVPFVVCDGVVIFDG